MFPRIAVLRLARRIDEESVQWEPQTVAYRARVIRLPIAREVSDPSVLSPETNAEK